MIKSNSLKVNNKDGVVFLTFPKISDAGGAIHGFSTRLGGVSSGVFSTMSFSTSLGDDRDCVIENYRRFVSAIGGDYKSTVLSDQTHTANVRVVTREDIGKGLFCPRDYRDVDGLITNESGIVLVTQYADCTPLAFYDPVKRVVAASHAGWRGTVSLIAKNTVDIMVKEFGSSPKDILCGIGPNIAQCCYEVDDPVINEIKKLAYPNSKFLKRLKELANDNISPEFQNNEELKNLKNQILKNEKEISNLLERIKYIDIELLDDISNEIKNLKRKNESLQNQIIEKTNYNYDEISDKESANFIINLLEQFNNSFYKFDLTNKRNLIKLLTSSITSDGETLYIDFIGPRTLSNDIIPTGDSCK